MYILVVFGYLVLYVLFNVLLLFISKKFKVKAVYGYLYFTIHAFFILIGNTYKLFPQFPDSDFFHYKAISFIESSIYGVELFVRPGSFGAELFTNWVIVPFYLVFGEYPLIVVLFNNFLLGISMIVLCYLTRELSNSNKKAVFFTFILALIYPALFVYSTALIRDSLLIFSFTIFTYVLYEINKQGLKKSYLLTLLFSLFLIVGLRPQNAPVVLGVLLIFFLISKKIRIGKKLLVISGFITLFVALSQTPLLRFFDSINPQYLTAYRYSQVISLPAAYLPNIFYNSWLDVFKYIPAMLFHYLFSPFPWVPSNYQYAFATVDSAYSLILAVIGLIGFFKLRKDKRNKTFLTLLMCLILISAISYSLVETYFGGAVRHRIQHLYLLLPFVAIFLANIRMKRNSKY